MEDIRALRTRQALLDALKEMICTREAGQITVQALTDRAGINRKTFYRHFETLDDLFNVLLEEISEAYMDRMRKLPVPVDIWEQTRVFFEFYGCQPPWVERLMCHESYAPYCERLHQINISKNRARYNRGKDKEPAEQNIRTAFLVSASMGLYRQWVWDGKTLPLDLLAYLGCRMIADGYRSLNSQYKVITLCGSTRFKDEFLEAQKKLTLEGNIVISVGLFGHSGDNEVWEYMDEGTLTKTKEMLDDMHKRKIDMADEIFVINVNGYIGSSTQSEIEYAKSTGKTVRYLEE